MHDNHVLTERRLQRVLQERVIPTIHRVVGPLSIEAWHVGEGRGEPVQPAVALPGRDTAEASAAGVDYQPFELGQAWGPAWGTTWFHLTGVVPPEAASETLEIMIDLGWNGKDAGSQSEGLVYRPDGSVVKALNPFNAWIPVEGAPGDPIDLYIEAGANPNIFEGPRPYQPTRQGDKATASLEPIARLTKADVNALHTDVWELAADYDVLSQLEASLDLGEPRRWNILRALERSLDVLDLRDVPGSAAAARAELADVLRAPASSSAHTVTAIGHAHIDSAWLWPVRETVRKVARTSSNVVNLLDSDPDLQFAMSSAQQYAWLKEFRPEVFERVKAAVAGGRFVPVGGMWVESDTNMVGSEAMVRQFTHGQRFFRDEFGAPAREVWLPDTFGYSAALPQIVKLVGLEWFLTQKISWNKSNHFPHHSFFWEGIDGTRVFTHFPPSDTYNGTLSGKELSHSVKNFREKGRSNHSLLPFGWGDGGGGPTREMLQRASRTRDLEGSPKVVIRKPAEFFAEAEAEYKDAPVWKGELYLELHRGTLTSQAKVKQGNRRSEHLFHEAELWAATAAVDGVLTYPAADLDRLWKLLLLHQFHDMLPGTGIAWVHQETRQRHAEIAAELEDIISAAQQALAGQGSTELTFNASPYERRGIAAYGASTVEPSLDPAELSPSGDGGYLLSNGLVRVRIDSRGLISSVVDVATGRETVPAGEYANLLQVHTDFPNEWDAWDIDEFYRDTVTDLLDADSVETVDVDGAPGLRVARHVGSSTIVQTVSLAPGEARVVVDSEIDWHERDKLLKAAFPVDVHTDTAAFETQFGHLVRPTHDNTTWEAARFEVSAHRWVHVGERDFGVAIVNDSTYGHDVTRHAAPGRGSFSTVRLSLLRAPLFPDPETDQGVHRLRYALVVGADIDAAVEAGYALNLPERRVRGDHAVEPLVSAEGGAVLETVKLADDGSGDVILRVYEPLGVRASSHVVIRRGVSDVRETDLLEDDLDGTALVSVDGSTVELALRPFQIVTLRMRVSD